MPQSKIAGEPDHRQSVAAVVFRAPDRYLVQLRDERPDIALPGYWGLFGGGIDPGETPEQALRRELWEELRLPLGDYHYITQTVFHPPAVQVTSLRLTYYAVPLDDDDVPKLEQHEGADMGWFRFEELLQQEKVTPSTYFGIFFHAKFLPTLRAR